MTPQLNVLYGVLTNGDNTVRKTTVTTPNTNKTVVKIVSALLPEYLSEECRRALAELYIRLIQTDKNLQKKLSKIDGINSYKLQSFREPFNDTNVIPEIISRIKALGLGDEENSFLPFDYIRNALRVLLEALDGNS